MWECGPAGVANGWRSLLVPGAARQLGELSERVPRARLLQSILWPIFWLNSAFLRLEVEFGPKGGLTGSLEEFLKEAWSKTRPPQHCSPTAGG